MEIVDRFPIELKKGQEEEGTPGTQRNISRVLVGLGLGQMVYYYEYSVPAGFAGKCRELTNLADYALLFVNAPTDHCFGVNNVLADGLELMNPEEPTPTLLSWEQLVQRKGMLIVPV